MGELLTDMSWVPSIRHEALTPLFKALTALGGGTFMFLFLGVGYWGVSKRVFARVGVLLALAIVGQACLKVLWFDPRPDSALHLIHARSFGFPSGHAWVSVVLWGYLAWEVRRLWGWILFPALYLGVSFSRIYLGVHDPEDILGGTLFGLCTLVPFLALQGRVSPWWNARSVGTKLGIVAAIQLGLIGIILALARTHAMPRFADSGTALLGFLLIGLMLEARYVGVVLHSSFARRLAAVGLGVAGALLVGYAIRPALLSVGVCVPVTRYVMSALLGLWIAWLGPLLFVTLRLAEREVPAG